MQLAFVLDCYLHELDSLYTQNAIIAVFRLASGGIDKRIVYFRSAPLVFIKWECAPGDYNYEITEPLQINT